MQHAVEQHTISATVYIRLTHNFSNCALQTKTNWTAATPI